MGIRRFRDIGKSDTSFESLRRLRSFLDREEPSLIRVLVSMWNDQEKAITYKVLREAILKGALDSEQIHLWQQDYSRFVSKVLQPRWDKAIQTVLEAVKEHIPEWGFNSWKDIDNFTQARNGFFVTRCTETQKQAINALIQRTAVIQDMTVDELSRVIRPFVGLTKQQAEKNLHLYEELRKAGRSKKSAMDQCLRLAGKQHRYRAMNIARTEMAWAYNKGEYESILRAQRDGYLGQMKKVVCTADDERVCPICGSLDGKEFAMEESMDFPDRMLWEGFMLATPIHCSCRCTLLYVEITPPPGGGKGV